MKTVLALKLAAVALAAALATLATTVFSASGQVLWI
jgi:hypothetical protein